MAYLKLYKDKLAHNYRFLNQKFAERGIEWGIVSKMLCGNASFLAELVNLGVMEIHDSRVSNLKAIKKLKPEVQTVYIKPPAEKNIPQVVRYADVSFNTELVTMQKLSAEAQRQQKTHKVLIMIEMGDLREGVMGEDLLKFYGQVFELPNLEIVGIGTNLNCLHGVMPSTDKLIQLSLYKQLVEATFHKKIPWISGGTSVTLPLLLGHQLPKAINHFRIGETLYFGNNLVTGQLIPGMKENIFELFAQIIELSEKPKVPIGELANNPSGDLWKIDEADYGKTSYRAILDIGLLDVSPNFLIPNQKGIQITGASSDMLVIDLGQNEQNFAVGDIVSFGLKYMGALGLMNSNYIDKVVAVESDRRND
ncbi:alanine/ornithine racemase family PLP-dependent enzyme [soil metagenome]